MSFSAAAPIVSTSWPGASRIVNSPDACTESVVFRSPGLPPMIPFTSADGSANVRDVELLRRVRVERPRALRRELVGARRQRRPRRRAPPRVGARDALRAAARAAGRPGRASTASKQRISTWIAFSAAPPYMPECRSRSPVFTFTSNAISPRVARSNAGRSLAQHAAVEDDRGVGADGVVREVVDDRRAADLLLAVAREAQVDRQRVRLDELLRGLQQDEELALVVGDAARVRPLVLDRELERVGLPELERRRRLHVEVAVAEDGRRVLRIVRRADLAERELLLAERRQLGGAADPPDEVADPLAGALDVVAVRRIGADPRDRDELTAARGCQVSSMGRDSTQIVRAAAESPARPVRAATIGVTRARRSEDPRPPTPCRSPCMDHRLQGRGAACLAVAALALTATACGGRTTGGPCGSSRSRSATLRSRRRTFFAPARSASSSQQRPRLARV